MHTHTHARTHTHTRTHTRTHTHTHTRTHTRTHTHTHTRTRTHTHTHTQDGKTPLMAHAERDNTDICKLLLENGAQIDRQDRVRPWSLLKLD